MNRKGGHHFPNSLLLEHKLPTKYSINNNGQRHIYDEIAFAVMHGQLLLLLIDGKAPSTGRTLQSYTVITIAWLCKNQ